MFVGRVSEELLSTIVTRRVSEEHTREITIVLAIGYVFGVPRSRVGLPFNAQLQNSRVRLSSKNRTLKAGIWGHMNSSSRRRTNLGHSLVEMIVAATVFSTLCVVAIPTLRWTNEQTRAARKHQMAAEEAMNIMDFVTSQSWSALSSNIPISSPPHLLVLQQASLGDRT